MNTIGYTGSRGRFCHSFIPSRTLSVIVEIVVFETSVPYTSARCAAISPCVIPRADRDNTTSSMLPSLRRRFFTIIGSNVPARSRGTSIAIGSPLVWTVFVRVPLRALPSAWPRSFFSYPRWSVSSPSRADSTTILVSSASSPFSPSIARPCARAWPTSCVTRDRSIPEVLGEDGATGSSGFSTVSLSDRGVSVRIV